MKTLYAIMVFLLIIFSVQGYLSGQINLPQNFQTKYSYHEVNELFTLVKDTSLLSDLDKISLDHELEITHTSRFLQNDGSTSTLIELISSPQNDQEWMEPVKYLWITMESASAYNDEGILLHQFNHSDHYLSKLAPLTDFFPDFLELSDSQWATLENNGIHVENNAENKIFQYGKKTVIINNVAKTVKQIERDENDEIKSETLYKFMSMPGGENVLKYSHQIKRVKLPSGMMADRIQVKTLSNHEITGRKGNKSGLKSTRNTQITVAPNPVVNEVQLLGQDWQNQTELIRIFNQNGKLVQTIQWEPGNNRTINMTGLAAGNYYLLLSGKNFQEVVSIHKS